MAGGPGHLKTDSLKSRRNMSNSDALKIAVVAVLVSFVGFAVFGLHIQDHFVPILRWIEESGDVGVLFFIGFLVVWTVMMLPGLVFSLGAGAIFGLVKGTVVVWVGCVIGETVAFILGRFLFRDWVSKWVRSIKAWQAIELAVEDEGWKVVLLLRLAPAVPFCLLNYFLGLTAVRFWPYSWASCIGIVPGIIVFVYVGSLAKSISEVASGSAQLSTRAAVVTSLLSGAAIVAVAVLISYYAKRAMSRKLEAQRLLEADRLDTQLTVHEHKNPVVEMY